MATESVQEQRETGHDKLDLAIGKVSAARGVAQLLTAHRGIDDAGGSAAAIEYLLNDVHKLVSDAYVMLRNGENDNG